MTITEPLPRQVTGETPDVLASILEDDVNLAVWRRTLDEPLQQAARQLSAWPADAGWTLRLIVADDGEAVISPAWLPEIRCGDTRARFHQEVGWLVDAFACLTGAREVGLRLQALDKAMCPRFHVDHVPLRLVTTWQGPGSEWLPEGVLPRRALGTGAVTVPDGRVNRLEAGDVALLKGERWLGNEGRGIIHRSPAVTDGERRLVMTLDWLA